MASCKPFLKWAGGKTKLVPFIYLNMPHEPRRRLIEPFAGSAALSLGLDFDVYLLNDSNPDLIGLYSTLKNERQAFIDYARSFFIADNNQEHVFYALRARFNDSKDTIERSALFVYLNRHAFNGLCRYNSKGAFNVPFGRYKSPYFPEVEMQKFIEKSNRIELMCGDFQAALAMAGDDDVVYCDPPYVPLSHTASFTAYAKGGFDLADQSRLALLAQSTSQQSQGVLISNHDTLFTREIYRDARLETINVQRNIAAKGNSRQKVSELLAIYGE
jgi:DNA adenine methylase